MTDVKCQKIYDAITNVEEKFIEESAGNRLMKKRFWNRRWGAAAVCLLLIAVIPFSSLFRNTLSEEQPVPKPSDTIGEEKQNHTGSHTSSPDNPEDAELSAALLRTTVGPVHLGMAEEEILALLGEPAETSNSGVITLEDGTKRINWFYKFSSSTSSRYDVSLGLANAGEGWILNDITTYEACDWKLPNGISAGSSEQEVEAACKNFKKETSTTEIAGQTVNANSYYQTSGHLSLSIYVEEGIVKNLSLGTYYADPPLDFSETQPSAYSFTGESVTIYQKAPGGWISYTPADTQRRHLEALLGIEELQQLNSVEGEEAYYLDFHNGTIAALNAEDESGAVYHLTDRASFETALKNGLDPSPALQLNMFCRFPSGTWNYILDICGG